MAPWQQRPMYPQTSASPSITSASSSVFQSSTSLATVSSVHAASPAIPQPANMSSHSAPLPSPSAGEPSTYFGAFAPPTSHPSQPTRPSTAQQSRQPLQPLPQLQQQRYEPQSQLQANAPPSYAGQRGGDRGVPETAPFLQDFNLVAEAAKRAQMACLARDLGDVGL